MYLCPENGRLQTVQSNHSGKAEVTMCRNTTQVQRTAKVSWHDHDISLFWVCTYIIKWLNHLVMSGNITTIMLQLLETVIAHAITLQVTLHYSISEWHHRKKAKGWCVVNEVSALNVKMAELSAVSKVDLTPCKIEHSNLKRSCLLLLHGWY